MTDISNVKIYLKTRSGNVNIISCKQLRRGLPLIFRPLLCYSDLSFVIQTLLCYSVSEKSDSFLTCFNILSRLDSRGLLCKQKIYASLSTSEPRMRLVP